MTILALKQDLNRNAVIITFRKEVKMTRLFNLIFTILLIPLFLRGRTELIDVTGDGVDDEIKIGVQSVVVEDGQLNKKYIVISGEEMLSNVTIDDYIANREGEEIAIVVCPGSDCWTEIYAFKNGRFNKVSEMLPGEVFVTDDGDVIGQQRYFFEEGGWIYLPYPLREVNGILTPSKPTKQIENTVSVSAGNSKDILIECGKNQKLVIGVVVHQKNIIIRINDSKGIKLARKKINIETPFIYFDSFSKAETITLSLDNSYSIMTPKTVIYVIIYY